MNEVPRAWNYFAICPNCRRGMEFAADADVTPENPGTDFYSRCTHCGAEIKLTAKMLRPRRV